jgi:hypothetical protein
MLTNSKPDDTARRDPLTTKEALKILEHLYDIVLDIEQLRREQSSLDAEDTEGVNIWCVCVFFIEKKCLSVFTLLKGTRGILNSFNNYGTT